MKESTIEIEHLVDCFNVKGSAELNKEQRTKLVTILTKEETSDDLLESLLERNSPDDLPKLISDIYSAQNDDELLLAARNIQKLSKRTLDHYFDEVIDDEISEYTWSKFEDKLQAITPLKRQEILQENETHYGPKFSL